VSLPAVVIYTDGACRGNPGPGGWGAVLIAGANEKDLWGSQDHTTNNRMEMTAVLEALGALKKPCKVHLHTDSKYVIQGLTEWLPGWKARGWLTADKKPVKNDDLWKLLDAARQRHEVKWKWVKGHAGDVLNERADALANRGIDEMLGIEPAPKKSPAKPKAPHRARPKTKPKNT
jgi:ribonuclease HI